MSACCIFLVYGKIVLLLNQLFSKTNVRVLFVLLFASSLPYISCFIYVITKYVRHFFNKKAVKQLLGFLLELSYLKLNDGLP